MTDELLEQHDAHPVPHGVTTGDWVMILSQPSDPLALSEEEEVIGKVIQINRRVTGYAIHVETREYKYDKETNEEECVLDRRIVLSPPDKFKVLRTKNGDEVWVGDFSHKFDKSLPDCCGPIGCDCCRRVCSGCCGNSVHWND